MAAEFLAATENGRLLVRDLRRTRSGLQKILPFRESMAQRLVQQEMQPMNTPYGLEMVENCMSCKLRTEGWYCSLNEDLLKVFNMHSHLTPYPGGQFFLSPARYRAEPSSSVQGKSRSPQLRRKARFLS
jgi:hypothetical protein